MGFDLAPGEGGAPDVVEVLDFLEGGAVGGGVGVGGVGVGVFEFVWEGGLCEFEL